MALRDGKALMPFGSPGNDVQPQAMLQVFLNLNVFGMDLQSAIEAPRFATYSYPASSAPRVYYPARLNLEKRISRDTGDALAALGHDVSAWPEWEWRAGAVCAVMAGEEGTRWGAADPRRGSLSIGY